MDVEVDMEVDVVDVEEVDVPVVVEEVEVVEVVEVDEPDVVEEVEVVEVVEVDAPVVVEDVEVVVLVVVEVVDVVGGMYRASRVPFDDATAEDDSLSVFEAMTPPLVVHP